METLTQPTATVCQMSGRDPEGRPILAVLAKRTYRFDAGGRCTVAEGQVPLQTQVQADELVARLVACPHRIIRNPTEPPGGSR